jgi:hypothetical protein
MSQRWLKKISNQIRSTGSKISGNTAPEFLLF